MVFKMISNFNSKFLWAVLVTAIVFGGMSLRAVNAQSPNADLAFDIDDLNFILEQIKFAERHAGGENLIDILPNASIPWGLRTVDGSFNNLLPGQENFGAADLEIPALVENRDFPDAQAGTTYNSADPVTDSTPRLISHLIVNQSVSNPAAVAAAAAEDGVNIGPDIAGEDQFFIPNTAPDEGLSAPFNTFMTFFGQFFDHGLGLINMGGHGFVTIPLQPDDPLFDAGPDGNPDTVADNGPNIMMMPRASRSAGEDGELGTADDVFVNATTPHVDQQQTYASHASSQILLRHYEVRDGRLQASGRMLNGFGNDRIIDTADDGGMATWDTAQAQGRLKLGLDLDDLDGNNNPRILADPYGKFIPGPLRGLPQLVTAIAEDGTPTLVEGDVAAPVDASIALRVNQSFFLDVAHSAAPNGLPDDDTVSNPLGFDLEPGVPGIQALNPRTDDISGQTTRGIRASAPAGSYDDELLGAHFICGDGRCNENIALTTIHTIFHAEHNRLTNVTKRVLLDTGNLATLNEWLDTPETAFPLWFGLPFLVSDASLKNQATTQRRIDALNLDWNGERVFQAARFGTEMQYNRIVFDGFGPTLAGLKDAFESFHTNVDPGITAEFSQSVYRFGHSMLTETVNRYDADFNTIDTPTVQGGVSTPNSDQLGLFEAFLNPLALFNTGDDGVSLLSPEEATGAVIRGLTRATANEIDEFTTGALQNNLVGLPLDLGAINIARGRDVGNPPLNAARRIFFAKTQDTRLKPYLHWADYADNLRHEPTLVNFVAAYGTHPSLAGADGIVGNTDDPVTTFAGRRLAACAIVGVLSTDATAYCEEKGFGTPLDIPEDARDFLFSTGAWASDAEGLTTTGLDNVDFWNGGLAEERMPFGGYLGSTHNYVFETQLEALQNGDRFYYVARTANTHFFNELESNSFTALAMRNTDLGEKGAGALPLNIFSVPNHILEVDQSQQFDAAGDGTTADPEGDADLIPLVIRDAGSLTFNIEVADTTRVVQYTGGDHVTVGGTDGADSIIGGLGNDRIEGGDGADHIEGGAGDDIITDLSGPDVIEGGDGNDAISSGNEEDVIFGDAGNDFIVNSSEFGEIFSGSGDDYILDGFHNGHIRGGAGDDWMENLGGGEDLFQGDDGAAPEGGEPAIKGNDVFIAHGGNNDGDMENGDDIFVDGPGIDRVEGQLGFDWVSFQNDTLGVSIDLDLSIFLRPTLPPSNNTILNRYDRVEGISGSPFSDILRGTANPLGGGDGNELTQENMALIEGLGDGDFPLVPFEERRILPLDPVTGQAQFGWNGGEIILGGKGSDLLAGEGGDDIIGGDASLKVAIRTPDPAIRTGRLGQDLLRAKSAANSTASQAVLDAEAVVAFTSAKAAAKAAVKAATAATVAANDAAEVLERAQGGLSAISITDAIGELIASAGPGGDVGAAWRDFLADCSAALGSLGFDVNATAADTAAKALTAQLALEAENLALTLNSLVNIASESAAAVGPAQDAVDAAQGALNDADKFILVDGMRDIQEAIFGGFINPGELKISRIISDDDPENQDVDSVVFTGNYLEYTILDNTAITGFLEVTDDRGLAVGGDGRDLIRNVERLVFADKTVTLDIVAPNPNNVPVDNALPVGQPTISGTPEVGEKLTASIAGVTDADNESATNLTGEITRPVSWTWQSELEPDSNVFEDIQRLIGGGDEAEVVGESLELTAAESGLQIRVIAIFQDDALVFERTISEPVTIAVAANSAPVANNDTATTFESTPVTINVLDNDTDADGDPFGISEFGSVVGGTVVNNGASFTYTPNAVNQRIGSFIYTVIDINGAISAPASVIISVIAEPDTTAPVFTFVPAATTVADPTAAAQALVDSPATATDPSVVTISTTLLTPFQFGTTTVVTWIATDGAGNIATATQIVTVDVEPDTTAPVFTLVPADVTVKDPATAAKLTLDRPATATDPSGVTITTTLSPEFQFGTTTQVTWIATDGAGNIATATQIVTVEVEPDTTAPVFTFVPEELVRERDPAAATLALTTNPATATDPSGVTITTTLSAPFEFGAATVVTWIATDGAGNIATATQSVTVLRERVRRR